MAFKEVSHPKDISNFIIDSDQFSFGGTFGIDFQFPGGTCDGSLSKCHEGAWVPAAVMVNLMRAVHGPFDGRKGIDGKRKMQMPRAIQIFEDTLKFSPIVFARFFDSCQTRVEAKRS